MAYARFGPDSDVYVFAGGPDGAVLECCNCALVLDISFWATSTDEMIRHLQDHEAAGHRVPGDLVEALLADQAENEADSN